MHDWKSRICDAWNAALPPSEPILKEEAPTGWSDAGDAEQWLVGKKWDDIASDNDRLDVEMPFFYLSDPACAYYLGGYLLHLAEAFDDEFISCLAPIHFAGFMGSERFATVVSGLSQRQRTILGEFAAEMLAHDDLFSLGVEFSAKLQSGVRVLATAE